MELDGCSSNANPYRNNSSGGSRNAGTENLTEKELYVNHAELVWNQMRTKWVGDDQSKKLQRPTQGSTVSLTGTYEKVLLTEEPFKQPIPLSEAVRFLVEIWFPKGLYD